MTERFDGKRVVVVGLAVSGTAAARTLVMAGARVTGVDFADDAAVRERASHLDGVDVRLGTDGADEAAAADLVVVSPGVRPGSPPVRAAMRARVPVWTEVELAYRLMPVPERLLGVTGTNGKTSTTEMIVSALAASGYDAAAAGNIGRPLVDVIAESHDAVVVELSSFQLHYVDRFRAHVGVLLNIAQDHLDWHGSFDAYAADKSKLFATQTYDDVAIHFDDGVCARAASAGSGRRLAFSPVRVPDGGAGVDDGWIVVPQGRVVAVADLHARGGAMIANAVAAAAAACALGADPARVGKGLASFEPGAHRMEHVVTIDDVDYVNDSKATNPHATLAALDGLDGVVLIAGGRNKGLDLSVLGRAGAAIRTVVSIGESAEEIVRAFPETSVRRAPTMEDAVRLAARLARPGDTVLLSPACASFDMFPDYRARGEAFRAAVRGLAAGGETT